ncbi:MAG: hypothetical protein ACK5HP_01660 [Bacilli bacterium]
MKKSILKVVLLIVVACLCSVLIYYNFEKNSKQDTNLFQITHLGK